MSADNTNENTLLTRTKPRTLKVFILERGCEEYQELVALRVEGFQDELLKRELQCHTSRRKQGADEYTVKDDAYWMPVMSSALEHIDTKIHCIPQGKKMVRFLDLGCCPGGFSDYVLRKNSNAQGVGLSLDIKSGGYGLAIPFPQRARFEIHWGDLTYFHICSPGPRLPSGAAALSRMPFEPRGFQLAMLDGEHRRTQESSSTHPWDIDRLLIAQLIIAFECLDIGGTLLVKLSHLESSTTARLVCVLDLISKTIVAFKPYVHGTRDSFYAVANGVGQGIHGYKRWEYLKRLKAVWWQLTYGGPRKQGRWLKEGDLDFIVNFDTLKGPYLNRLIKLGRGAWRAQSNALQKTYKRIRKSAATTEGYNV